MGAAVIGSLKAVLGLDTAQFDTGWTSAQKRMRDAGQNMQRLGGQIATVGAGFTATLTAPLIAAGFAASKAAVQAADAMGQVDAALASMGNASRKTSEELAGLAEGLMRNSLYDDDDILRSVTANLLTFGNVAGAQFDRAQQAAVDLATRMKTDLQSAALLVGKALNDPIKGMSAMGRAGIQFTDAQKTMIKGMVEAGNVAGAQAIILGELERRFGGAAKAAQDTDPYDRMRDSLNSLSESAGGIINRFLVPFLGGVAGLLDGFNNLSPKMQEFVVIGAGIAAALGPALVAIGAVVGAVGTLVTTLGTGGALAGVGAFLAPLAPLILPIAAAVGVAVGAFLLFRDDVEPVLKRLWETAQETLGPALGDLFATVADLVRGFAGAWTGFFDGPAGQVISKFAALVVDLLGNSVVRTLTALVTIVEGTLSNIGSLFSILGDLLTGDFAGAWETLKGAVTNTLQMLGGVIEAFWPGAIDSMRKLYEGVKSWLQDRLGAVFGWVARKVGEVGDAFFQLYDRVVGHSYIPDMVEGVASWMAKLDAGMVVPARAATESTRKAFEDLRSDVAAVMSGLLTDSEKAARDLARDMGVLDRALAAGPQRGGITRAQYDDAVRRRTTEVLAPPEATPRLRPLTAIADLNEALGVDRIKERISEMRTDFADAFADGLDAALRGDWTSVLRIMFGDSLRDSFRGLGKIVFDALGMGKGGGGGGIAAGFSNIVASFAKLPKLKDGGILQANGMSGADSQLVSFWKSPAEQVTVNRPGQLAAPGGNSYHFQGNLMTPEFWRLIQQGDQRAAQQGAASAVGWVHGSAGEVQRGDRMLKG